MGSASLKPELDLDGDHVENRPAPSPMGSASLKLERR